MLKLRPHHLLCLRHFEGKGYNLAFIDNMYTIQHRIKREPFQLVCGCDDICALCQHRKGNHCESSKPAQFDKMVFERAQLSKSEVFYKEMEPKMTALDNQLESICKGCQWIGICKKRVS